MSEDAPFRVPITGALRERLIQIGEEARAAGLHKQFLASIRMVSDRLRFNPLQFGEEIFDLKALKLTVRVGVALPVAVEFGVYLEQHLVIVRSFRFVPPG